MMAKRGATGVILKTLGARDHDLTVVGTETIAPSFHRVWMTSPSLFDDLDIGPTAWVRLWVPDPEDPATQHQRGYTIATVDPATGNFAIDFVLHEPAGPASSWALRAREGDTIQAMVLGSMKFTVPEDPPAGYLLVGDPASIPAINGLIGAIPDELPIELYLEEHGADERLIPLAGHPRLTVHRVPRAGAESLPAAIAERDWSNWYAWAAPESGTLKVLRKKLRDELGFPKSEIHAKAYWVEGRAMGSSRDGDAADDRAPAVAEAAAADDRAPVVAEAAATGKGSVGKQGETPPAPTQEPAPRPEAAPAAKGEWRADASRRLLAPLKRTFWTAGVLQGLITVLQLVPYVLLVELARQLLDGAPARTLATIGFAALGILGAGVVLEAALHWWLHRVDAAFGDDLRRTLLGKLARLPLGWFTSRGAGRVKKLVQDDPLSLHYLVTHAIPDAVAAVVAPVAVLVYLFAVDWRMALILLVPVLVYIVTMYLMVAASGPKVVRNAEWTEDMNAAAAAYLDAQPVVRVFGGAAASAFLAKLDGYLRFLNEWQRPFIGKKTIMDLATRPTTFLWLLAGFGTVLVVGGRLDPIDLLPFLVLGTTFGARLLGIGYGVAGIRDGVMAARNLQVTLEEPELARERPVERGAEGPADSARVLADAPATAPGDGPAGGPGEGCAGATAIGAAGEPAVEFDGVDFGYRPGVPVLHGITLSLWPGTVTALVGPSGSGKSTLAGLVARFHDVTGGTLRIHGRDIRGMGPDELYRHVGFVFQDPQLVRGTVAENIALARPDASDDDIRDAARRAQIHERILALPDGYGTVLGDGAALSGGERQRLTIARALLADTPILVLDEATAFADPESEYEVQKALSNLAADRTVLVIAHRLHTIAGADRIVVLEDGRIVDSGRHDELLSRAGRYRDLWRAGRGAAEPDMAAAPSSTGLGSAAPSSTATATTTATANDNGGTAR